MKPTVLHHNSSFGSTLVETKNNEPSYYDWEHAPETQ